MLCPKRYPELRTDELSLIMDSFSWAELLKLDKGAQVLHHTGHLATITHARPCRYEDGDIELHFNSGNSGSPKLLQLNYRPQLEHHVFYHWSSGLQVPKFQAGQQVWRRGDEIGAYRTIESISPNSLGSYNYYLKDSLELHPESCLVHRSLAT